MSIRVQCPGCGSTFTITNEHAEPLMCRICKATIDGSSVPAAVAPKATERDWRSGPPERLAFAEEVEDEETTTDDSNSDDNERSDRRPRTRPQRRSNYIPSLFFSSMFILAEAIFGIASLTIAALAFQRARAG